MEVAVKYLMSKGVEITWGPVTLEKSKRDEHYNITEENLKKDNRVELLIASKQVQGNYGTGQGFCISGKGELQFTFF